METFAQKFLKLYDRKIMNGEITFSSSGIKKDDFTRLCIDGSFVFPRADLEMICDKMSLSEEQRKELLAYVKD